VSDLPRTPQRRLEWPPFVEGLARIAPEPERLLIVGGAVRDALLGRPLHDLDLAASGDGLAVASALADRLGGAYYPLDLERGTGRVVLDRSDTGIRLIDVARLRGRSLLDDLRGRDFTLNAIATPLADLERIIDPLGGEVDLYDGVLRLCSPSAIADDPIRALRAVRLSLQFGLRLAPETTGAIRRDGPGLAAGPPGGGPSGLPTPNLAAPERARQELIAALAGSSPSGAVRLLDALGLLEIVHPALARLDPAGLEARLAVQNALADLLTIIGPTRDDNIANNFALGVAVMILDRHRRQLQEHLSLTFADGRPLVALLGIAALTPEMDAATELAAAWRLSNAEVRHLSGVLAGLEALASLPVPPTERAIHCYYRAVGRVGPREAGVDAALLHLARTLAGYGPSVDHQAWAELLDEVVSPLLDAFFRRHQQIVAPPPLVDGRDLMLRFDLPPGPRVGQLMESLLEEQAAGVIRTREEALRLAESLIRTMGLD
jgi:poly(A) polymerase